MRNIHLMIGICLLIVAGCLSGCSDDATLTDIYVENESVAMLLGNRAQIVAVPVPLDAENQKFEWTSADNGIATVTPFGIVEAVGEGTTTITVKEGSIQKTISVVITDPVVIPPKQGQWLFDDPTNFAKANIGQDLIPVGTGFTEMDGPTSTNKAVRVALKSYYQATHGITPADGETKVGEYTLMFYVRVPDISKWHCLIQTDPSNTNDGDVFIRADGRIGVGTTGYSTAKVTQNKWQRVVVSVKNKSWVKYYLDGELILSSNPDDYDRFLLVDTVLFFADEEDEDEDVDVAEISMWKEALDDQQVKKLERVN